MRQAGTVTFVLKGYPRLSETFIAQEILGLEKAGLNIRIVAMRRPTDVFTHPVHREIKASVEYLPEYLHQEPIRVLKGLAAAICKPRFIAAFFTFLNDLRRDFSRNRLRRFGQALVLANELPADTQALHAHFIHTPASVCRYASILAGLPWSCSAHAKDIWTTPDQDLRDKLMSVRWAVTCTLTGQTALNRLAPANKPVHLQYHGFDRSRFPPLRISGSDHDGSTEQRSVRLLAVGRAVEKKGFDLLLDALSELPPSLHWSLKLIGGGERLGNLRAQAEQLGLASHIEFAGAQPQEQVLEAYKWADIFVLPCRVSADGDRDGLPNVIVEAMSQSLAILSTFVSAVPELVENGRNGLLVAENDSKALRLALEQLIINPAMRKKIGKAAAHKVHQKMGHEQGISALMNLFENKAAGKQLDSLAQVREAMG